MARPRRSGVRAPDRGEQLALPVPTEPAAPAERAPREAAPPQVQEARSRPPVILQIGPREFAVLAWVRDEAGAPVYRIAQQGIKAASTAVVMARKIERKR